MKGHLSVVNCLLERKGAISVDSIDNTGYTPLMWAVKEDLANEEIVKSLIAGGAEINRKDKEGDIAAGWAARCGHKVALEILLYVGRTDANYKNDASETLLILSVTRKEANIDVVRFLLENGANVGEFGDNKKTAKDWAIENERRDIVELLDEYEKGKAPAI